MADSLFDRLQQYKNDGAYPFHMPGHKRNPAFYRLPDCDLTEITGFDNLHQPEGAILQAEERAARLFGAEQTFFLVNGSSGGIIASILAVASDGDTLIAARNVHRSVYSGALLCGAKLAFMQPEALPEFAGSVLPETVQDAVSLYKEAKAVLLTSPTYEGVVSDLSEIARIVHEAGMILIVDEAHGAHMKFHPVFPKPALFFDADLVVQSVHKTLPAPTQCALLHVQGKRVDRRRLSDMLAVSMTSSPSYLFMGAVDFMCGQLFREGEAYFEAYARRLLSVRETLGELKQISLFNGAGRGKAVFALDIGKLVLKHQALSGRALAEKLLLEDALEMELAQEGYCLAMTSVADTEEGFFRLAEALRRIDREELGRRAETVGWGPLPLPKAVRTVREAAFSPREDIPLHQSAGRVSAGFLTPYPPGIPILAPGEEFTEEMIAAVFAGLRAGNQLMGVSLENHMVSVLKVL